MRQQSNHQIILDIFSQGGLTLTLDDKSKDQINLEKVPDVKTEVWIFYTYLFEFKNSLKYCDVTSGVEANGKKIILCLLLKDFADEDILKR